MLKNVVSKVCNAFVAKTMLCVAFVVGAVAPASAALPAEVTALITGLTADFTELTTVLWPVVALTLGFFILVKWVRRGSKATT